MQNESRTPIVVGVGQLRHNRERDTDHAREPLSLMVTAIEQAATDAGIGDPLLHRVDAIAIPRVMSWLYDDLAGEIAAAIGSTARHLEHTEVGGNKPVQLLDEAAARIAEGVSSAAIVCGGEAAASLGACLKQSVSPAWSRRPGGPFRATAEDFASDRMVRYGLAAPIQAYPLYENALRTQLGQSFDQAQGWSAQIYSDFSKVAAGNDAAWDPHERTADEIATVSPHNRMICHPYPLLMNAQPNVDQAAAVIVTSVAVARELNIPESRWVYVWGGAGASDSTDIYERVGYTESPAMQGVLDTTLTQAEVTVDAVDVFDSYSCFPIVPKLMSLALGLPRDTLLTATGGLTSFGGPANNYSMHSLVAVTRALRQGKSLGLVYANGELLTKHHAMLLSRQPHPNGFRGGREKVAVRTDAPRLIEPAHGTGRVETYTVQYDRHGSPTQGWVIGRDEHGDRFPSLVHDRATLDILTQPATDPIGRPGEISRLDDGRTAFAFRS